MHMFYSEYADYVHILYCSKLYCMLILSMQTFFFAIKVKKKMNYNITVIKKVIPEKSCKAGATEINQEKK